MEVKELRYLLTTCNLDSEVLISIGGSFFRVESPLFIDSYKGKEVTTLHVQEIEGKENGK